MPAVELAYLDASAVKLVVAERETQSLKAALQGVVRVVVASEILEVEVLRASRRAGGDATSVRAQLAAVRLLPLTGETKRWQASWTHPRPDHWTRSASPLL